MKKSKKATRSIKPVGRSPVIAVRVPEPLHQRIKKVAGDREQSMSETMADLITKGLDWTEAFGEHQTFFRGEREKVRQLLKGDIKAGLLERGWTIVHHAKDGVGIDLFAPPEAGFPKSGFLTPGRD